MQDAPGRKSAPLSVQDSIGGFATASGAFARHGSGFRENRTSRARGQWRIMILAEMTPDPKAFWQFFAILSFLLAMAASGASIAAFFTSRRVQRREITFGREFATKEDLLPLRKDIERVEARMESEFSKIRSEIKEDRLLIMAAAEARQKETLGRISRLDEVLGNVRDRIPR